MEGNEEIVQEEPKKSELVLISKTDLIELINPIIEGINKLGENQVQIYKKLEEISNSYAMRGLEKDLETTDKNIVVTEKNMRKCVERLHNCIESSCSAILGELHGLDITVSKLN